MATPVRISSKLHDVLQALASQEGESMQAIVERAVEQFRRQRFLEGLNQDYAALKQDAGAWSDFKEETEARDSALQDGLEEAERP